MNDRNRDPFTASLLGGLSGDQSKESWGSGVANALAGFAKAPPILPIPTDPRAPNTTYGSQFVEAQERVQDRLRRLNEAPPSPLGRVIPDIDDLTIGSARRLNLAVLFLDICHFSEIDSQETSQQDQVLMLLNLFMSEMLHIVRHYDGVFEKNTGDGLMAYFGESTEADSTQRAVDAAITMHFYNDHIISRKLLSIGLQPVRFRIGIDTGPVTIAKVGVRGDHQSLVAIGNVPNVACKLMTMIPEGGIVLGAIARNHLSTGWQNSMVIRGDLPKFFFRGTSTPYSAWELTYRAPNSSGFLSSLLATGLGNR